MNNQQHKTTKKVLWGLLILILTTLLIPVIVAFLLFIPAVQNFVLQKAVKYGSDALHTELSLGGLYLEPFRTVRFDEILIMDQRSDTLLYIEALRIDLTRIDRKSMLVVVDEVQLLNPYYNLYIEAEDSVTNMQFLLDAFQSDPADTSKLSLRIECDDVSIENLRFDFHDFREEQKNDGTVDFNHLGIRSFSGKVSNIGISDSLKASIVGLHFTEMSGLQLRRLNAEIVVRADHIGLNDLELVSNLSMIEGSYAMHFEEYGSFSSFFTEVELKADLTRAQVHFYDLGFFSKNIRNMLTPMEFEGRLWGTLSDLKGDIDSLRFADHGFFSGKLRVKGLPDLDAFNINADILRLTASAKDLERLKFPTKEGLKTFEMPEEIDRLGQIGFRGKFIGFIDDFVAFGDISTALGDLKADMNVKTGGPQIAYAGSIKTNAFDLRTLLNNPIFGSTSLNLEATGEGFEVKTMKVKAEGRLDRFDFNGYSFQNITVDGTVLKQVFEGSLSLADPNAKFDFVGKIDAVPEVPIINCVTRVTQINLGPLGLVPEDTFGMVSGSVVLKMFGWDKQSLNGQFSVRNFEYASKEREVRLDSFILIDNLIEGGHSIDLASDLGKAHFEGRTNLFDLPFNFLSIAKEYAPGFVENFDVGEVDSTQQFDYDVLIYDKRTLEGLVSSDFHLDGQIHLYGKLRTKDAFMDVHLDTISWRIGELTMRRQTAVVFPDSNGLRLEVHATELSLASGLFLENIESSSLLYNDSLETSIFWNNMTTRSDSGTIRLLAYKSEAFPLNLELNEFYARIADATWISTQRATLRSDSSRLFVQDLDIRSAIGQITCNGEVAELTDANLDFDIRELNLGYISRFGLVKNDIQGKFNGRVNIYKLKDAIVAETDLQVDSLIVDDFEIGSISGDSRYSSVRKAVDLNLALSYKEMRNVRVVGEYYPFNDEEQLDLEVALNDFRVSIIEPFVSNYVQQLEGVINGSVSINGNLNAPKLVGAMKVKDGALQVDYLKTFYQIPEAEVRINDDMISADWVSVLDPKGSEARLNATVYHDKFKNLNYEIFLNATDFMALNTTIADNDDYYGTANITGDVTVSGVPGFTEILVDAYTNKNTKLSIPLDDGGELGEIEYIRFVEPKEKSKKRVTESVVFEGERNNLNLDFQLAVNDDAEIQIIFDEKIGDIIKVRGNGDMLMRIDNRGTFNMYGDYTMTGGDYLFTLQNVVNKRFTVVPGSKISWSGSPLEANVDLTANYNLRAAPINLTSSVGDTSEVYRRRMPVDVKLRMQGKLLEPEISFDVDLPSLPESDIANQLLDPRTTSELEMNEHAFALLLTNNFFVHGSGVSAFGVAGQTTTYEMMSNQFSNWVSQYFDNIDFGVNYRPSDENAGNQTEVNVSTELFNDRVLVEVNGSVQGNNGTSQDANNVAGEFNVEYKINKSLRARVYNEANNYNPTNLNQSPYTQGVGVFYRKEFDLFLKEFFQKKKRRSLSK
ncbi:MAG: translocation/assembly module TamB domain-containing protein [Cryomorphaceae bacterium]